MNTASGEHARLILKLSSIAPLLQADTDALAGLPLRTRSLRAGEDIVLQGDSPTECCFVIDGLICRYILTSGGGTQIVSFHIPGDLPDRDSLHLPHLDHSIAAISQARVAFIPHEALQDLATRFPNIAVALWRDAVIDAGVFRQWLASLGRRNAKQRVAHLICEVFSRMADLGLADGDHFRFPVTQSQLGDALGLSSVHINRTLQELRAEKLIVWNGPVVTIPSLEDLSEAGEFDPSYLRLKPLSGQQ